jgi:hypothetical protein
MIERYHVLESDPADDGLRWQIDRSLAALLPELGFTYRFREGDEGGLVRDLWESDGTQVILGLVADHQTPSHYVMVEAVSDELADRVMAELETVLPVLDLEQLQERAERDDDPGALVRLAQGLGPGGPDARSAAIIERAFGHPDALTRYRAAEAAGLVPRAEYLAKLEQMAAEDPDESVRQMAEAAAQACRS